MEQFFNAEEQRNRDLLTFEDLSVAPFSVLKNQPMKGKMSKQNILQYAVFWLLTLRFYGMKIDEVSASFFKLSREEIKELKWQVRLKRIASIWLMKCQDANINPELPKLIANTIVDVVDDIANDKQIEVFSKYIKQRVDTRSIRAAIAHNQAIKAQKARRAK